jgi:hypothetical protein
MSTSNSSSNANGGIGFFGVLFIVFLVLKLVGVINWSWWLVFAPIWAPVLIALILGFGFYLLIKPR